MNKIDFSWIDKDDSTELVGATFNGGDSTDVETIVLNAPKFEIEENKKLDLKVARARFAWADAAFKKLKCLNDSLSVIDDKSAKKCTEITGMLRKLKKNIDTTQSEIIHDSKAHVDFVRGLTKPWRQGLDSMIRKNRTRLERLAEEMKVKKLEQEKIIQEETEQLNKRIESRAQAAGVEFSPIATKPVVKKDAILRVETESGSVSIGTRDDYEVEDKSKVPLDYLIVDDKKVKDAQRAGITIPGIKYIKVNKARFR